MRRIDAFLIDRVFQQVADVFERWVSCYGLAGFLATGAIIGIAIAGFGNWLRSDHFTLACDGILAFGAVRNWRKADQAAKSAPRNVMPVFRIEMFRERMWALFWAPFGCVLLVAGSFWGRGFAGYLLLHVAAIYFLACRRRPPARQRQEAPWGRLVVTEVP